MLEVGAELAHPAWIRVAVSVYGRWADLQAYERG